MKAFYSNLLILTMCFTFNALAYAEESSSEEDSSEKNNQYYTNGYSKGITDGMALCKKTPRSCGISLYTNIGDGQTQKEIEDQIKAECLDDPASCGIETDNSDGSTKKGIAQCKNDPQSCGIPVSQDGTCSTTLQQGIQQGIQQCKDDPQSYGIPVSQDGTCSTTFQQGIQQGIQQCKDDPQSYGIPVEQDGTCSTTLQQGIQQGIQQGKKQCKDDPASCEIIIENAYFSMSDGKLFLPRVDIHTAIDGTLTTLKVEMQMIPGRDPLSFSISDFAQIDN
jgi:hypothetical protein